jgi:hypothetical protein
LAVSVETHPLVKSKVAIPGYLVINAEPKLNMAILGPFVVSVLGLKVKLVGRFSSLPSLGVLLIQDFSSRLGVAGVAMSPS